MNLKRSLTSGIMRTLNITTKQADMNRNIEKILL